MSEQQNHAEFLQNTSPQKHTKSEHTSPHRLSLPENTPITTPIDNVNGLRFSDSILHMNNNNSKPPLPRGITISTSYRNRSRSIEAHTTTNRSRLWNRKFSHDSNSVESTIHTR